MDIEPFNHSAKRIAIRKASEEVTRALNSISDIFKDFQDDYLLLLQDNENLRKLLKQSSSSLPKEVPKKARKPQSLTLPSPEPLEKSTKLLENSPEILSPIIPYTQDASETLGIVETTQFSPKVKQTPVNPQKAAQLKKNLFSFSSASKNNDNSMQGPSNINPFPSTSKNTNMMPDPNKTQRSQNPLRILSLSRKNVCTRINSSGKIDKQSKLVYKSINTPKTDVSLLKDVCNTTKKMDIDPKDLEIDDTMFEKPFEMEEIIELSPNDNSRLRGRLRLKNKQMDQQISDDTVLSDFEMDSLDPSLTQLEKTAIADDKRERGKSLVRDNNNLSVGKASCSPALVENGILIESQGQKSNDMNETYFSVDSTFFSQNDRTLDGKSHNKSLKVKNKENPTKKICFGDVLTPVLEKSNDNDLDIDYDGDWDTDVSMDKWTKSPPNKKQFMDSFDVVPEKKKTSPKFAYKVGVTRNKAERAKLQGWTCKECEKYYENMNLSEEELKKRMNQCSRHRGKFNERYNTPPGFWNPVFDTINSQETVK